MDNDEIKEEYETGIISESKGSFTYALVDRVEYSNKTVSSITFRRPNMKQLKEQNVSISEKMESAQIVNTLAACAIIISDSEGSEFGSTHKRKILDEIFMGDSLEMFGECAKRFFGVSVD